MATTTEHLGKTGEHFESAWAEAGADPNVIPWKERQPNPALVNWLNAVAPSLVRCGARVAIVGCGLGADAREFARRGYEVTGFDYDETAIRWARNLDPEHVEGYVQADLFNPPPRWVHRFDLVVDVNNLQALEPDRQRDAVAAMAKLITPHGHLLIIGRAGDEPREAAEPPWPLNEKRLLEAAEHASLAPDGAVCSFTDDVDPSVRRIRGVFKRS